MAQERTISHLWGRSLRKWWSPRSKSGRTTTDRHWIFEMPRNWSRLAPCFVRALDQLGILKIDGVHTRWQLSIERSKEASGEIPVATFMRKEVRNSLPCDSTSRTVPIEHPTRTVWVTEDGHYFSWGEIMSQLSTWVWKQLILTF